MKFTATTTLSIYFIGDKDYIDIPEFPMSAAVVGIDCQWVPSGKTGVTSRRTYNCPAESSPHIAQQPTDTCFRDFPVGGSTDSQTSPKMKKY